MTNNAMSWFLMLAGLMLMICRESGALSSDWKTIFLGISFALINIAFSITCDNIYKNEARIVNLEEEIAKLKEYIKNKEK